MIGVTGLIELLHNGTKTTSVILSSVSHYEQLKPALNTSVEEHVVTALSLESKPIVNLFWLTKLDLLESGSSR